MKKLFYLLSLLLAVLLVSCSSADTDNKDADDANEPLSLDRSNFSNGHAYVDLGLSVKWATCNVGANNPEEYGDYFAWGETEPKSEYYWRTYKWCKEAYVYLTKYCTDSSHGTVDNKTVLDLADDAANANWGGNWRMPTIEELQELVNNCTWIWTTQNGVNGCLVTSKKNGNSIFLPAAGFNGFGYSGLGLYSEDSNGYYWSSSLVTDRPERARHLYFYRYEVDWWNYYRSSRYDGLSVRPVLP